MAQEELQKTPNGVSVQGKLRLRNGLHARPAARLAKEWWCAYAKSWL